MIMIWIRTFQIPTKLWLFKFQLLNFLFNSYTHPYHYILLQIFIYSYHFQNSFKPIYSSFILRRKKASDDHLPQPLIIQKFSKAREQKWKQTRVPKSRSLIQIVHQNHLKFLMPPPLCNSLLMMLKAKIWLRFIWKWII